MVNNVTQSASNNGASANSNSNFIGNLLNSLLANTIGQTNTGSVGTLPGASSGFGGANSGGGPANGGGGSSSNPSGGFSAGSGFAGYDAATPGPVDFSASTNGNDRRKYIRKFDTNQDRILSREEILNYFVNSRKNSTPIDNDIFLASDESADIYKVLNNIDTTADGSITDAEAALTLLKIKNPANNNSLNPELSLFILNYLNNNINALQTKVDKLDLNKNGKISNLELLNSLMLAKTNQINLSDADIDVVLRTNSKYQDLLAIINTFGTNYSGTPNDQDVFNILLSLRGSGSLSADALSKALYLAANGNALAIESSLDLFDSQADGELTDQELINALMSIRRGDASAADNQATVNLLDAIPAYKRVKDAVNLIDPNADGKVSDDEIIDFLLAKARGVINADDILISKLVPDSAKLSLIKTQIDAVDKDDNGIISDQEYMQAVADLGNQNLSGIAKAVLTKILAKNPNSQAILAALNFVDKDGNSIVSPGEVAQAMLAAYRGETSGLNQNYFNIALGLNTNKDLIQGIIDRIDPNHSGTVANSALVGFYMNYRQGNFAVDTNLVNSVYSSFPDGQKIVDAISAFDGDHNGEISLREYTQAIINIKKGTVANPGDDIVNEITSRIADAAMVRDVIAIIDADNNGTITAIEFASNFMKALMGPDGKTDLRKLEILSSLKDIIYPGYADIDNFRNAVDVNHDNILSDNELIDALLKINGGTLQTPAAEIVDLIFSANPNKSKIITLVNSIDQNKNGTVSNIELTNILMKVREGEFAQEDLGLVQAILHKNSNFDSVQSLVDLFDKDQNGAVTDLEMFDALFKIKGNRYQGQVFTEVVDTLKASNQNSAAIEALINNLDPNNNGIVDYDELVQAFLKINAGSLTISDEVKRAIPSAIGTYGDKALSAEKLVDLADSNSDGQISDIEIANMIIANKKTHNLNAFDSNFVSAVFRTNPNSTKIEGLINSLDKDGDGNFSDMEVVQALLSQRKNPNAFGNDFALVQTILSSQNSSYNHINNLIAYVDSNNSGDVSNIEVMKTLVDAGKNLISANDKPLVDAIAHSNSNADAIIAAYNSFGINPNSATLTNDLFKAWIAIQQGTKSSAYFTDLVSVLGKTAELNAITARFSAIDTDHNGRINSTEYGNFLVQMRANHQISADDLSLANFLADADPSLKQMQTTINTFDPEGDGYYSDRGIVEGLTRLRALGQEGLINTSFMQTILTSNSNTAAITKLLNLVDPNHTGTVTNNSVIPIWQNIQGGYGATDPAYDFNGDGKIDYGDMATVYALLQVANNRQDITFKIYDKNTPWNFIDVFFKKP